MPMLPKFAALLRNLEALRADRPTTGARVAVYSNLDDVGARVVRLLRERFGDGSVLHLLDSNATAVLREWNRTCTNGHRELLWSTTARRWANPLCSMCLSSVPGSTPWIIVIEANKREGIDLFWTHELHVLDPCARYADDVQLRARIRRTQDVCKTNVGLNLDAATCHTMRRPVFEQHAEGARRASGDTGSKTCCAVGIRFVYYIARMPELHAFHGTFTAMARVAVQNAEHSAAIRAFQQTTLSFDDQILQSHRETFRLFHDLSSRLASAAPMGFAKTYTCKPATASTSASRDPLWGTQTPYPYQKAALATFERTVAARRREMLLMHGAGTGKSVTALACMRKWTALAPHKNRTIMVVPTTALAAQWMESYGVPGAITYADMGVVLDGADESTLVVFDEAHYLLLDPHFRAMAFSHRTPFFLFVTATPVLRDISDVVMLLDRGRVPNLPAAAHRTHSTMPRRVVHSLSAYGESIAGAITVALVVLILVKVVLLFLFATTQGTVNAGVMSVQTPVGAIEPSGFLTQTLNGVIEFAIDAMSMGKARASFHVNISRDAVVALMREQFTTERMRGLLSQTRAMEARLSSQLPSREMLNVVAEEVIASLKRATLAMIETRLGFKLDHGVVDSGLKNVDVASVKHEFLNNFSHEVVERVDGLREQMADVTAVEALSSLVSVHVHALSLDVCLMATGYMVLTALLHLLKLRTRPRFDAAHFVQTELTHATGMLRLHAYYDEGDACIMPFVERADTVHTVPLTPVQQRAAIELSLFRLHGVPVTSPALSDLTDWNDTSPTQLLLAGRRLAYVEDVEDDKPTTLLSTWLRTLAPRATRPMEGARARALTLLERPIGAPPARTPSSARVVPQASPSRRASSNIRNTTKGLSQEWSSRQPSRPS